MNSHGTSNRVRTNFRRLKYGEMTWFNSVDVHARALSDPISHFGAIIDTKISCGNIILKIFTESLVKYQNDSNKMFYMWQGHRK